MPRIRAATIEEHKRLIRRELFAAAERLFAAHGYEHVSHADIAAEAGVGRTTFYDYFTSKGDLLACLVEERIPQLVDEIRTGIATDGSYSDQLTALAIVMLEFVARDHTLGMLLYYELPTLPTAASDRIAAAHARLGAELIRIYRSGVSRGEFRELPDGVIGPLLQDTLMAGARALMRIDPPPANLEDVTTTIVTFLLRGLAP